MTLLFERTSREREREKKGKHRAAPLNDGFAISVKKKVKQSSRGGSLLRFLFPFVIPPVSLYKISLLCLLPSGLQRFPKLHSL